ncbi:MAG: nucleotide-binding universal stress UspA family protein, partial [Planctomycetota bacterium]
MNYIKKILVAIDFSDPSEKAFVVAADLSRQLDASLHVIHIVQIHASNIPESGRLDVDAL